MRTLLSVLFVMCQSSQGAGQTTPAAQHWSGAELQDMVASAPDATGNMAREVLRDGAAYSVLVLRRDQTGEAEVHQAWDDVIVVQAGAGTLVHGGKLSGGRQTSPGEIRGGVIAGGVRQRLTPGDVSIVPAGVAHQVEVAPGQSILYIVVKTQGSRAAR